MASIDSSFAESMKAQVLITSTSASSARAVISIPRCKTLPSMISASTRFFAQPRLIMPTFGRDDAESGDRAIAGAGAEFMALLQPHVGIAADDLAILPDLD